MSRGLLRHGAVLALLLGCVGAGVLVAWWSGTLLAGLLCTAALGLGAMLVLQSMRAARLLAGCAAMLSARCPNWRARRATSAIRCTSSCASSSKGSSTSSNG
jgi:hypothetical protein